MRSLTLHQLKDIISDVYASKAKSDIRQVALCMKLSCPWHQADTAADKLFAGLYLAYI